MFISKKEVKKIVFKLPPLDEVLDDGSTYLPFKLGSVNVGNALASAPQAIISLLMKLFGSPVVKLVGSLVGRSVGLTRPMLPEISCRE